MPAVLRVVGLVVWGVVLVIVAVWAATYFVSENRLNQAVDVPREAIAIPSDITSIQRGQHLASAVAACVDCHGPNLVRAIRHGVDPTGRQLLIMPSDDYNHFSDPDLGAIIAYVRSIPAIDTLLPRNEIRLLGRALFAIGQLQLQPSASIDHFAPRPVPPCAGVTPDYGKYLADSAGCPTCHGPGFSGGKIPQAPSNTVPAANITPLGLGAWSDTDFIKAMRTGIRPDGWSINTFMPWPFFAQMTDDELRAIWRFLQILPPRPTGSH